MRALVLAAGIGSRLKPITNSIPKCLVQVGNQTMLEFWVKQLSIPEINQVVINVHHFSDLVLDEIAKLNERDTLAPSVEPELLGTAGTLLANIEEHDDSLLVVHCDNFSSINLRSFIEFHERENNFVTLGVFEPSDTRACGMVSILPSGIIDTFIEKPLKTELQWGNAAIYLFSKAALGEIASNHTNAFDIAKDILPKFANRMSAFKISGTHIDVGTFEGLKQAQEARASG